ncbi:hypothetical protein FHX08_000246 [Rhizobium sp. BK529]|uniref:hypothetical protein n=1 Tax=unclassified Rhizobium TaxID=2613769 RepID=UPI0010493B71|nr:MULTISPECIES: hypothetical protein [unclassified Rhizobium]MBB3589902.1 hypothetical protein [Rhizobium sp. BK529]TCS04569.1 hypothetical protein EV281_103244 [Rhizobium sp. BK418]
MKTIDVRKPQPFDAHDLSVCQPVFDTVVKEAGIDKASEEAARIAAIMVELYRQGVRDPEHLRIMVEGARGLFSRQETVDAIA